MQVGADSFRHVVIPQGREPAVEYFISTPNRRAPLVLYIQGSGCSPAFIEMQPGRFSSTVLSLTTIAHSGRYAVMIVNKPYAERRFPRGPGLATGCSDKFNGYFSYGTWLHQVQIAYRDAIRWREVDRSRTLVIGVSEGATIAAGLAAEERSLQAVALVGGSGPGQYYDFIVSAYRSGDDAATLAGISAADEQLTQILKDPNSSTKFAWGHPFKRWSSFFRANSTENLLRSNARVYLLAGMQDESVPIASGEVSYATLRVAGRNVTFRRLPAATHDLLPASEPFETGMGKIEAEFFRIVRWFDPDGRINPTVVLGTP